MSKSLSSLNKIKIYSKFWLFKNLNIWKSLKSFKNLIPSQTVLFPNFQHINSNVTKINIFYWLWQI